MIASWYFKLLANKPGYVMASVTLLAVGSATLTGLYASMPDFSDPTLGFETRGTDIAVRIISWNHLFRPLVNAARLFQQPNNVLEKAHSEWENKRRKGKKAEHAKMGKRRHFRGQKSKRFQDERQQLATRDDDDSGLVVVNHYTTDSTSDAVLEAARLNSVDDPAQQHNESKSRGRYEVVQIDDDYEAVFDGETGNDVWPSNQPAVVESRDQQARHDVMSLSASLLYNYCNEPTSDHARIGMKRVRHNLTDSLFELNALRAMCALEQHITRLPAYQARCEKHPTTPGHATCCHRWSLPSYVAMMNQVPSCSDLQPQHVVEAESLLKECRHYYLDGRLRPNCWSHECNVPKACRHNNAAYNTLHYLMNIGALDNGTAALNVSAVLMIMPFAKSSQLIALYEELQKSTPIHSGVGVVAMDLGMDDALFDKLLVHDSRYIYLGGVFIMICIWFYTHSLLMTIFTLLAIVYSLSIAVFVYKLVLQMDFFPFMNVLAVLVNVGIGADDVFIYISMWRTTCASLDNPREEHLNHDKLAEMIGTTLRHAAISMGVTSLTTACAFFTSWFNAITTIKCFGLFAGVTVVCNYLVMLTWIPATVSLLYRLQYDRVTAPAMCCGRLAGRVQRLTNVLTAAITAMVTKQRVLWIVAFGLLFAGSFAIVFVHPRFRLASSAEHFRMFAADHPFEVYKREFSNRFYFDNVGRTAAQEALFPLTFVWGVLARDNGVYSDPNERGTFELDAQFEPYAVDTQQWLRKFCRRLREQPFYNAAAEEPAVSTSCFVETFDANMQRACLEPMTRVDQTPCCNTSTFPYKPDVFRDCLPDIITSVYATPRDIFPRSAAGPLFGAVTVNESHRPRNEAAQPAVVVQAIVVEFDSNVPHTASFESVDRLVAAVQTWFADQLAGAPEHMRRGWFTSDLQFYDLQRTLYYDTLTGILISLAVACAVLVLATVGDLLVSLCAFVTIMMSIGTTVAGLVLLDWRLNVLESIAISTSIGLAIDCSLHYALAYRELWLATREQRATYALGRMIGPTAMAALTTGAAGVFMMPSQVLPYIQMGEILVLLMVVSWSYATFFLMAVLCVCGPQRSADGSSWRCECNWFRRKRGHVDGERVDMELLSAAPGGELEATAEESCVDAVAPKLRALRLSQLEPETESESLSTSMSSPTNDAVREFPVDRTKGRAASVPEVDETIGTEEQTTSV